MSGSNSRPSRLYKSGCSNQLSYWTNKKRLPLLTAILFAPHVRLELTTLPTFQSGCSNQLSYWTNKKRLPLLTAILFASQVRLELTTLPTLQSGCSNPLSY